MSEKRDDQTPPDIDQTKETSVSSAREAPPSQAPAPPAAKPPPPSGGDLEGTPIAWDRVGVDVDIEDLTTGERETDLNLVADDDLGAGDDSDQIEPSTLDTEERLIRSIPTDSGSAPPLQGAATTHDTSPADRFQHGDTVPHIDSDTDPTSAEAIRASVVALRAPLIGRDAQLTRLKEVFLSSWNNREVHMVTLVGAPGLGKTRIAREFARSVNAAIPDARVLWGTAIDRTGQPYEAVSGALADRFGIGHAEAAEDARDKIAHAVAESLPEPLHEEVTHLLAHLMGVPFPESPVVDSFARELRDLELRCHIAVRRFLEQQAQSGPLLLCFDSLENAKPQTIGLLQYLAQSMRNVPVLIIAAACPDLLARYPDWKNSQVHNEHVNVTPLDANNCSELFRALTGVGQIPRQVDNIVRARSDGSPRAIFDLARYLLEVDLLRRAEGPWQFSADLATQQLPQAHDQILLARMEALPPNERNLLLQASAFGDVFWVDALVAVRRSSMVSRTNPDGPSLETIAAEGEQAGQRTVSLLTLLSQRGMIVDSSASTIAGEREYRFAYPPMRELAYGLLNARADEQDPPAAVQRRYHRLIAQWIELRPDGGTEYRQEQVAYHCELADDRPAAAQRYRRAAIAARDRNELNKALTLFQQALACLGDSDIATRVQLWHNVGELHHMKGDLDQALDAFERMLRLGWVVASRPKAALAYNQMGRLWRAKGNLDLAYQYLQRSLEMSRETGDQHGVASCLNEIGRVHWIVGRYELALDRAGKGMELRRHLADKRAVAESLTMIGRIEHARGILDAAEACHREALSIRRELRDRFGYLTVLTDLADLDLARGRVEEAKDSWERTLREAQRLGALTLQVSIETRLAEVALLRAAPAQAREHLDSAVPLAQQMDDQIRRIDLLRLMGMVALQEGDTDKARRQIKESLRLAESSDMLPPGATGLLPLAARAEMALGEVHARTLFDASVPPEQAGPAETHFHAAADMLRRLGAEAELTRSLRRLGEYTLERGDWQSARSALEEAFEAAKRLQLPEADAIKRTLDEVPQAG